MLLMIEDASALFNLPLGLNIPDSDIPLTILFSYKAFIDSLYSGFTWFISGICAKPFETDNPK